MNPRYGIVGETTADITDRGFRWSQPAVLVAIYAFVFGAGIAFAAAWFPEKERDMKLVIIESPYAGDVKGNTQYAQWAMRDALKRGEAPFASHLLYPQPGVLDDDLPEERQIGIAAGLAWGKKAEATVVYIDRGMSTGMRQGIHHALAHGRKVIYRMGLNDGTGPIAVEITREQAEQMVFGGPNVEP